MSWLFKSLQSDTPDSFSPSPLSNRLGGGGVKYDLSVVGESIGRQLCGVAYFLVPPPLSSSTAAEEDNSRPSDFPSSPPSQGLLGIRNDLAEIGGSLKAGLSLLSSNKAVSEISKFTSSFLQFQTPNNGEGENEDDFVPGITEEVIAFVEEISKRPECWTDFPLSLHDSDFKMSDAQREHASTAEHMVPSLRALRANLHNYMEDARFWMIYFILLLPRLNEDDFEILSTSQIVEIRSVLLQKLQNKRNVEIESAENSVALDTSQGSSRGCEKQEENNSSRGKEVTDIVNATRGLEIDDEENAEWLKEMEIESTAALDRQKKLEYDGDVSFSDLEDDDNDLSRRLSGSRQAQGGIRAPSPSGSNDWVQLNECSEISAGLQKARQSISREKDSDVESTDWLKVDDFD